MTSHLCVGVIWNNDPVAPPVIPAKAGIQSVGNAPAKVSGLDSRSPASADGKLRGNDRQLEIDPPPNETTNLTHTLHFCRCWC
jgi:hypothetical protein